MPQQVEIDRIIDQIKSQLRYMSRLLSVALIICATVLFAFVGGMQPVELLSFRFDFRLGSLAALAAVIFVYFLCARSVRSIATLLGKIGIDQRAKLLLKTEPGLLNPFSYSDGSLADYVGILIANVSPFLVLWIAVFVTLPTFFSPLKEIAHEVFFPWMWFVVFILLSGVFLLTFSLFAFRLRFLISVVNDEDCEKRLKAHDLSIKVVVLAGAVFSGVYGALFRFGLAHVFGE